MNAVTYSQARGNLAKTMDKVCDDHSPIIITRKSQKDPGSNLHFSRKREEDRHKGGGGPKANAEFSGGAKRNLLRLCEYCLIHEDDTLLGCPVGEGRVIGFDLLFNRSHQLDFDHTKPYDVPITNSL
jgi:hypothetical protein